jgi:LuxR family maltose regulon positive regulatory protein
MAAPLLTTKLYIPPPHPNLVPRPNLVQQLDGGLHLGHKLTLVSAPAGFGKTTLLSEWIAGCRRPVAWISLDEGNNDLVRFLTYLVAALQTIEGQVGQGVSATLQSPGALNVEPVLVSLINEIADLRFTLDEVAAFLAKATGLELSAQNVAALGTRTEGWIARLQLAALSMQRFKRSGDVTDFANRFTGSDRYIQDYLADEVLRQRPKGTRDFFIEDLDP